MNIPTLPPDPPIPPIRVTGWPDVGLTAVREMPALVFMSIIFILAIRGDAKASDVLMSGFGYFTYNSTRSDKGSMPTKSTTPILPLLTLGIFAVLLMHGCGASVPTPAQQAVVLRYEAEQLACVADAGTKEEADACRDKVKAAYGRNDAGVGAVQ